MNLKELSKILSLSQTTVSRALNGYPEVSAKTREIVESAAIKYDYRPNSRARGLATGRSKVIGYVMPLSTQHEIVNPIFGDFIAGASQTYAKNGYDTMISLVEDADLEQTYRDLIAKRAVDGIILQAPKIHDDRISLLNRLNIPFVVHGRTEDKKDYNWVDVNNFRAFKRATELLLNLGHQNIALINGDEHQEFAYRRREGFKAALKKVGLSPQACMMHSDEMTETYGYTQCLSLLDLKQPPTAILVSSLITAIGVRRAIEERDLKIGKDISVVTHDDDLSYLKNGQDIPIFTATRSSIRMAGRQCAEMLIDLIQNPDQKPKSHIFEAELLIGQSTGPCPGNPPIFKVV